MLNKYSTLLSQDRKDGTKVLKAAKITLILVLLYFIYFTLPRKPAA